MAGRPSPTTRVLRRLVCAAAVAMPLAANAQVTFNWATVADPGNAPDTRIMTKGGAPDFTTGYGSVNYTYRIARDHVTTAQYVTFLNAVDPTAANALKLYDARMTTNSLGIAYVGGISLNPAAPAGGRYGVKPGFDQQPANWITFQSGARFANWLQNGQGSGGTETGAYTVPATTSRDVPARQPGATFFMPSENEFYKAAYYDPTKNGTGGYWEYGVRTDAAPVSTAPPGGPTAANYAGDSGTYWQTNQPFSAAVNYFTAVGAYPAAVSYYGLRDVDGQLYNWVDGAVRTNGFGSFPIFRGGSFYFDTQSIGASHRNIYSFANVASYAWYGLRIGSLAPVVANASWAPNADGAWGTTANWTGGVPDGTAASATFGPLAAASRTVALGTDRTLGALAFAGAVPYTLLPGRTLTLDAGSGSATLTASGGTHTVASDLTLADPLAVSVAPGATLALSGTLAAGPHPITLTGGGTLALSGPVTGTGNLIVDASSLTAQTPLRPVTGTLRVTGTGAVVTLAASPTAASSSGQTVAGEFAAFTVTASGTLAVPAVARAAFKPAVLVVSSIDLTAGGRIDLGNADLIVRGGAASLSDLRALVATGALLASASQTSSPHYLAFTTLAVIANDAGGGVPYFSGYDGVSNAPTGTLAATDVIIKYTYVGDTDLDGVLDGQDFVNLLEGYSTGKTGWQWGDVDLSGGVVTPADVTLFLAAYDYYRTHPQPDLGGGQGLGGSGGAVPEPGALFALMTAAPIMGRRPRR